MTNKKARPATPTDVERELRQEVGHGCPVPTCRSPLLTYHHFDPPWNEIEKQCERDGREPVKEDHKATGMIALCREHHDSADGGNHSRAELRALKSLAHDVTTVRQKYIWSKKEFLVRAGGIYIFGSDVPLAFGGANVVQLGRGPDGLLMLSFQLRTPTGDIALQMVDNTFSVERAALFDLVCTPQQKTITARLEDGPIALELDCRRMSIDKLRKLADADARAMIRDPDNPEDRAFADDCVARICERAVSHVSDDEGLVPVLDFKRLVTYSSGRKLTIDAGVEALGVRLDFALFILEIGSMGAGAISLG